MNNTIKFILIVVAVIAAVAVITFALNGSAVTQVQGEIDPDASLSAMYRLTSFIDRIGVWVIALASIGSALYIALKNGNKLDEVLDYKLRELRETQVFTRMEEDFAKWPEEKARSVKTVEEGLQFLENMMPKGTSLHTMVKAIRETLSDLSDGPETPLNGGNGGDKPATLDAAK